MSFLRRFVRMVFRSRRVASVELGLAPDSPAASSATPEVSVVVDDGGHPSSGLGTRACSDIAPSDAKHGVSAPSSFPTPPSAVSAPSRSYGRSSLFRARHPCLLGHCAQRCQARSVRTVIVPHSPECSLRAQSLLRSVVPLQG